MMMSLSTLYTLASNFYSLNSTSFNEKNLKRKKIPHGVYVTVIAKSFHFVLISLILSFGLDCAISKL